MAVAKCHAADDKHALPNGSEPERLDEWASAQLRR